MTQVIEGDRFSKPCFIIMPPEKTVKPCRNESRTAEFTMDTPALHTNTSRAATCLTLSSKENEVFSDRKIG